MSVASRHGEKRDAVLTEQQKYRKAHALLSSIAQIMSEQGQKDFDKSILQLIILKRYLQERKNVVVTELSESSVNNPGKH